MAGRKAGADLYGERRLVPQLRWGTPEDVGKTVAALVGGGFHYSTGAVIEVSGGMNLRRL